MAWRLLLLLLLGAGLARAGGEDPAAAKPRTPLNRYFKGKIVRLEDGRVTLYYDFEDPAQLEDFEDVRPPHLLDAGPNVAKIVKGRLRLERSSCVRHRMEGEGRIEARFVVNAARANCVGAIFTEPVLSGSYSLTTIWDRRFNANGAFWLYGIGLPDPEDSRTRLRDGLNYRDVASIDPRVVARHVRPGEDCEMAVVRDGWEEWARLGPLHVQGSLKSKRGEMRGCQFGFWVHENDAEFDDLYLTIAPPQEYLDLNDLELRIAPAAPTVTESSAGRLAATIRKGPLSPQAEDAARELSRRGPDGWKELVKLIRAFAKKEPWNAVRLVGALAAGPEPERQELLVGLYEAYPAPELRLAVALGLAPYYPARADLVHDALHLAAPGRVELFRAVVSRGLPDDVVRGLFRDELLAREAYGVLRARAAQLGGELGLVPRLRALEGLSPSTANAFGAEFAATRDWDLLTALTRLLQDRDPQVAEGAYLLLLSASGVDVPPDADLWRSWISAKRGNYEPPPASAPGPVAAAILRGRDFLRRDLMEDGACEWPSSPEWPGARVGATALAVYALRAAGVPADDPAIEKAVQETLVVVPASGPPALRDDLEGYTYALSMLAMALHAVDAERFHVALAALGRKICDGQLENGQWTYHCERPEYKAKGPARTGDNSNTQYAILGLRAVRRSGIGVDPTVFERTAKFWLANSNAYGGWGYGPKGSFHHELSMTAAGISTLVICAEALEGPDAARKTVKGRAVGSGHQRLGEILLQKGYAGEEIYTWYGIERACILTGTKSYEDFDWYHEGAKILVDTQKDSGAWGDNSVRGVTTGRGYGEAVDTSFALLFLKRSTTRLLGVDEGVVIKVPRPLRPAPR